MEIGPYVLIELLGEGGMGAVWLADQRRPVRRRVALKLLRPGLDAACVRRFDAERQTLAMLNHEHVAKIFDAGLTDDGRPFFAMEHVTGAPITTYADHVRASTDQRLTLFVQVCDAVEHAHQRGVIHRDLKPSNILVSDADQRTSVKVIDFGIAKALLNTPATEISNPLTEFGTLVGTPEYMSPEQAGASGDVVDTRADIYSLGVVLYELLIGTVPFDTTHLRMRSHLEMLRVIRDETPPRVSAKFASLGVVAREIAARRRTDVRALADRLHGDLDWIVARCLEKSPARRYPTVSDLSADIGRHLNVQPVTARPPHLSYRLEKFVHRHRLAVAGATIAVLVVVAAAVISIMSLLQAERARRELRSSLTAFHVDAGLRLADDGDDLRALPWLVRALELEEGGALAEQAHRVRIGHVLRHVPVPVHTWAHAGLTGAAMSPDRGSLVTWDRTGTAQVWRTETGQLVGAPLRHPVAVVDARLSDNAAVVTADARGVVRVWDAAAGTLRREPMPHGVGLTLVRITPDGSRVLSADSAGGVKLFVVSTERPLLLPRHDAGVHFAEFLGDGKWLATGGGDGRLMLTPNTVASSSRFLQHPRRVVAAADVTPATIITTDASGATREWEIHTGALKAPVTASVPNGVVTSATRPSDRITVLCGVDGAAMVRRDANQALVGRLDAGRTCYDVDVSADEMLVATGHNDGSVRVWSSGGQPFSSRLPLTAAPVLVRFLPNTRALLAVDGNGAIRVWDLAPAARAPRVGLAYTWTSAFSPDGRRLAMASGTSSATPAGLGIVVDTNTMVPLTPPLRHATNVRGIAFSPDGTLVATVSDDGAARLWDSHTGEPATEVLPHDGGGQLVTFSVDGQVLIIESYSDLGGGVTLRRVPTGEVLSRLPSSGPGLWPDPSPDGRHVVVVEPPDRIRVWRTDGSSVPGADWTGYESARFLDRATVVAIGAAGIARLSLDGRVVEARQISRSDGSASRLFVSGDRSRVAWMNDSGGVEVWSTRPTLERLTSVHTPGYGLSGALSADGSRVLVASAARVWQIWTVTGGNRLTPVRHAPQMPLSATFSPDDSHVQISGIDADVWRLEPDARPAEVLRDLALHLSAHEIDGTKLIPIRAERLGGRTEGAAVSPEVERRWGAFVGAETIRTKRWARAVSVFSALVAKPDAQWDAWAGLGTAQAERGQWSEAIDAFDRALAQRPDSTELLFLSSLARYAAGDAGAILHGCKEGLERHRTTRNGDRARWLARLCQNEPSLTDAEVVIVDNLVRVAQNVGGVTIADGDDATWIATIETQRRPRPAIPRSH